MKVCLLGSGSRGNSIYVEYRGTAILIDQGFPHKTIEERLASRGMDSTKVKALFISHEHTDHINGAGVTARKLDIPVYGTIKTLEAKRSRIFPGNEVLVPVESGEEIAIGQLRIQPYSVSHDGADPVQYCVTAGARKLAVATDLGFASTLVIERLKDADIVAVESNHDVEMLKKGPYPWQLKQRIMSRTGHLSNRNAAELIFNLAQNRRQKVVLAHLSEENNTPDLAVREIRELFARFDHRLHDLVVACQDEATVIIEP